MGTVPGMAAASGDRSAHFPAIERKHGQPIAFWLERLRELDESGYPAQIAYLREEHGFSQAHANAVVMWFRGSTTSKRFDGPETYFAGLDPRAAATMRALFHAIQARHPDLELVMAWNKPMLRRGDQYVIGADAATRHITVAPFGTGVLAQVADRLAGYTLNKKTFTVPLDWDVDADLLDALVQARLAQIDAT